MNRIPKKKKKCAVKGTWKSVEARIARDFGTTRTPLSGSNSKHTASDTLHKELFIEVKHRKGGFSVSNLWKKSNELAKKENKVTVVAIHEKGSHGCWYLIKDCDLQFVAERQV